MDICGTDGPTKCHDNRSTGVQPMDLNIKTFLCISKDANLHGSALDGPCAICAKK